MYVCVCVCLCVVCVLCVDIALLSPPIRILWFCLICFHRLLLLLAIHPKGCCYCLRSELSFMMPLTAPIFFYYTHMPLLCIGVFVYCGCSSSSCCSLCDTNWCSR